VATQQEIDAVKIHLPDEAEALGITDAVISGWLDGGLSGTKTVLASWRSIAAKTVGVEDISESGSTRTQRLHERSIEMIRDWQARADAEDSITGTLPPKAHAKVYTVVRV